MDVGADLKGVFVIALLAFFAWYFFVREDDKPAPSEPSPSIVERVTEKFTSVIARTPAAPPAESHTAPLHSFVDKHAEAIFSPLETPRSEANTTMRWRWLPRAENAKKKRLSEIFVCQLDDLNSIHRALRSHLAQAQDEKERRVYATAELLCRQLRAAIDERNNHLQRLAHNFDNPSSSLHKPGDTQNFFEDNVRSSWKTKSVKLRSDIQQSHAALRELESQ